LAYAADRERHQMVISAWNYCSMKTFRQN
jgi:hypothetical protein